MAAAAALATPTASSLLVASTAVSLGATAIGGFMEFRASQAQREAERIREQQLALQGVQRSNEILQDEIDAIAQVNVAAAASGIDPFTGSPKTTKQEIREKANRQLNVAAVDTEFAQAQSRSTRNQLRLGGMGSLVGAAGRGSSSLLNLATQRAALG